jgi:Cu/Ag efflux pump CusA
VVRGVGLIHSGRHRHTMITNNNGTPVLIGDVAT